jgi:hypothetical protein
VRNYLHFSVSLGGIVKKNVFKILSVFLVIASVAKAETLVATKIKGSHSYTLLDASGVVVAKVEPESDYPDRERMNIKVYNTKYGYQISESTPPAIWVEKYFIALKKNPACQITFEVVGAQNFMMTSACPEVNN